MPEKYAATVSLTVDESVARSMLPAMTRLVDHAIRFGGQGTIDLFPVEADEQPEKCGPDLDVSDDLQGLDVEA